MALAVQGVSNPGVVFTPKHQSERANTAGIIGDVQQSFVEGNACG